MARDQRGGLMRGAVAMALSFGLSLGLVAGTASASADDVHTNIIGGHPATQSYPFIVSMQKEWKGDPNTHWCGGSLVAPTWVVLAAHCVTTAGSGGTLYTPVDPATLHVRIGSNDRTTGGTVAGVSRIAVHPYYVNDTDRSEGFDIALLKLDRAVTQRPVPLATTDPAPGTMVRQLGWGYTSMADAGDITKLPVALQELDSPVVPPDTPECVSDPVAGDAWGIRDGDLCVDNADGVSGACGGDSGSPALRQAHGRWELVGVTSRGPGDICGTTTDIYTSVARYRYWITTTISR